MKTGCLATVATTTVGPCFYLGNLIYLRASAAVEGPACAGSEALWVGLHANIVEFDFVSSFI